MSAISEIYNRTHNVLELEDVLPNVSFTASETERDYGKNGKYELTNELPNDARLKKTSKSMELKWNVQSSSQNQNLVNTSKKLLKTRY